MLMAEAGYIFLGCILLISGQGQGQEKSVCALTGSTVHLPCSVQQARSAKKWYTVYKNGPGFVHNELFANRSASSDMSKDGKLTLTISDLKMKHSKSYCCVRTTDDPQKCFESAVSLQVTDLTVKFSPSAEVTEGHRATLNCSTSCSLMKNYIWSLNNRPLTGKEDQILVLDKVRSQDAGRYSCSVRMNERSIISTEMTLTVVSTTKQKTSAVALLVILPFVVVLWIRKKSPSQSPRAEASNNVEQVNCSPINANTSAEPTERDDHHYTTLIFSEDQTEDLYLDLDHQAIQP
ncbi:hemicentin-1-like [Channa argus]|uniref:hemicentin-1-like n=1 Tax=Channa argus TaxID=215402 RepID=UPI002944FF65|nr:hypothetical protein Q8A73_010238 [Channa argus]